MRPPDELEEAREAGRIPRDIYETAVTQGGGFETPNKVRAEEVRTFADYGSVEERALAHAEADASERVKAAANEDPNAALQAIDERVRQASDNPQLQLAILIMACTLAVRRVCVGAGIFDRGRRSKVIKSAVQQFDGKLRRFVWRTPD